MYDRMNGAAYDKSLLVKTISETVDPPFARGRAIASDARDGADGGAV